jgi:two-component system phosphate regulon sensor histidine kinase PhoR
MPLTALALAAVPLAALGGLAMLGLLAPVPAMLAGCVVLLGAIGLAAFWLRDLARLADAVRQVGFGAPPRGTATPPALPRVAALARDLDRAARATAARIELLTRLRQADEAIVDKLPDPLIVLDADRLVRRANAAAEAAFGTDMQAVLRHPGLRTAIDRAVAPDQGEPQRAELTLAAPVPRDVHATVIRMDPPLSDGGRTVVVLSDRTRERAVERMRADFVANASHELRTPLASLIGFIETLQGPAADDKPAQHRFLGIMAEQAARMNRLIDDLLSLSRIELTEHQPPADRIDIVRLLARITAGFEPRLAERRIALELDLADALPPVIGDGDQLAQVLQNLLDNAVKYGRDAGVLRVTAKLPAAAARWPARPGVVIAVADQGQGIAREHLPRLTERFYRADKGRSRMVGGTGLGLAIVKHIVSRHRGQLLIESEVGVGTTVSVWLPQAPEAERATPGGAASGAPLPAETGATETP